MLFKIQFHTHTRQDPVDNIKHSEKQLIDAATAHGYHAIAITCHNKVVFNDDLREYAQKKGILLIPGIEKSIGRRHVLIINATVEAEKIFTFNDLADYKKYHPRCLIIAPHPYYPGWICLHKKLEENIKLFDAIEYSWYHSKKIDFYNQKAKQMAAQYKLPMLATADNHILKYLNHTYSLVEAEIDHFTRPEDQKNIPAIFNAIKKNHVRIVSQNLYFWRLITSFLHVEFRFLVKKFLLIDRSEAEVNNNGQ